MREVTEYVTWRRFALGCCGMEISVPLSQWEHWKKSEEDFWCPRCGDRRVYKKGKTREKETIERLEREAKRMEQERNYARSLAEAERRSHIATRGHLTRQKKRAAAGTCPCCKRTFNALSRHIQEQHPEYVEAQR